MQRVAADDGLAAILAALRESGEEERTIVMFLSDHGMPLPFAKTQLYFHSTRTPWMVRWPGVTAPGTRSDVATVGQDLAATVLDAAGVPPLAAVPGDVPALSLRAPIQAAAGREAIARRIGGQTGNGAILRVAH